MKFRISMKLKNIILNINFAILTFFYVFCPMFRNILGSVGMKIFFFFLEGKKKKKKKKMQGRHKKKKNRVGRVSGNTGLF